jgi:Na+/pantothenate symporter
MTSTNPVTIATFLAYIAGVFVLAALSHRFLAKKEFLSEYFLGSRGLRSWSLAFAFAATATSGGSFIGFPSLIYSYGWILAFWIASYMIYPLCAMGVMGKRLNQVARTSGAITIPDVLRDRFESPALGLFTTCTILLFTTCNLVAQFKAGALIVEETFNLPESWGYTVGLLIFAAVVVIYTAYGGFRAVVWTDVMQGVVMGVGVVFLLPVIVSQVGGLDQVVERIRAQPPTLVTSIPGDNNDLAFVLKLEDYQSVPIIGVEYVVSEVDVDSPSVVLERLTADQGWVIRVELAADAVSQVSTTAQDVRDAVMSDSLVRDLVRVELAYENDGTKEVGPFSAVRFVKGEERLFGPGKRPDGLPFHPLGLAISYFLMWAITAMGQPGMMVRLMAFKDSKTLKRAMLIVTGYFAMIYIPLVFIFTAARILLPYIPPESADKAMVLVATRIVGNLGPWHAVLAAVFVAAPFAAVMSTVDSFLLLISSSIVRDIYQRSINPKVTEKVARWVSYVTTVIVGVIVTMLATRTIDFLQYIVVFTSSGFACTFLAPTLLGIYWKDMTREGALASAIGGLGGILLFFIPTLFGGSRINLLGLHPVIWGLAGSFLLGVIVSRLTGPSPAHLVRRYFYPG